VLRSFRGHLQGYSGLSQDFSSPHEGHCREAGYVNLRLARGDAFRLADQEDVYAEALDAMLADLAAGYPLGTQCTIAWSRGSHYER
jgi:hypothetical protein